VISDPELAPNTALLERADKVDQRYRKEYGNPNPLVSDDDEATHTTTPRQPVHTTPALIPAPIRSTPLQAPAAEQTSLHVPNQVPPRATAQAKVQDPGSTQQSRDDRTPVGASQAPTGLPPAGVAEALRMLNSAQHPPASPASPSDSAQPATNGKVPAQQIGVLGSPGN
jgi:pilus assembly protein CpaC